MAKREEKSETKKLCASRKLEDRKRVTFRWVGREPEGQTDPKIARQNRQRRTDACRKTSNVYGQAEKQITEERCTRHN